jgi:hypothetical protein
MLRWSYRADMRWTYSLIVCFAAGSAAANVRFVSQQNPDIQGAIDASDDGDFIFVFPGDYCGATITAGVRLVGLGFPRIVGCPEPAFSDGQRIGFLLDGADGESPATGTRISGFVFDGEGVSNENLEPIAYGVLARFASDVRVVGNVFLGTVQAVTNSAGDDWQILLNSVEGLTLFDCVGACGGGDAIVVQIARGGLEVPGGAANRINRPERNVVVANRISGAIPDEFDVFDMIGIFVMSADRTLVAANHIAIPENPTGAARGIGILVTNFCCGVPDHFLPGARNTAVILNDGRRSQFVLAVAGPENTQGLIVFGNRGAVLRSDALERAAVQAFGEGDIAY